MDKPFQSSAPLRYDLCNTIAELQSRYSSQLPDRAVVYVVEAESSYRLFKGIGAGFDNLTGQVVVPADQTSNRWLQQSVFGSTPWAGTAIANADVNVTPSAQFAWTALGSTAGSFGLASGDANMLVVNTTTSLITYHGPTMYVTVRYQVSLINNGDGADITLEAAISHNNDVPPADTSTHRGAGEQAGTVSDIQNICIAGQRSVLLADTNTLRLMLRNMSGTQVMGVHFFSLAVGSR